MLFKGKLASNFMLFYLMLISCLSDMVSTYIMEENAKINICCSYREKKSNLGTLRVWVSQSVPVLRH